MTITKSAIMNTRKALLTLAAAALTGLNAYATDIVVKPGAYTIEKALQQAREARRLDKATDICLRLEAGTYNLNQPIIIRPEDNGTRIVADGNAVISGGVKISGWKKEGKYYVASVPDFNGRPLEFRQMWVNGKKAVRARDVEDFEDMFRIRNIDNPIRACRSSEENHERAIRRNGAARNVVRGQPAHKGHKDTGRQRRRYVPPTREPRAFHAPMAVANGYD